MSKHIMNQTTQLRKQHKWQCGSCFLLVFRMLQTCFPWECERLTPAQADPCLDLSPPRSRRWTAIRILSLQLPSNHYGIHPMLYRRHFLLRVFYKKIWLHLKQVLLLETPFSAKGNTIFEGPIGGVFTLWTSSRRQVRLDAHSTVIQ
jgi:hypothetical protein